MEETLKKLIAVDKAARKRVEEAELKRDSFASQASQKKNEMLKNAREDFSRKLNEKKQQLESDLEKENSSEKISAQTVEAKEEMDLLFSENKDKWVDELFNRVIS